MWPEEVIIGNPESQIIVGTVDVIKTVCRSVRSLIGTVQPFDHLFERTKFFGYFIVVGKSNYLSDFKLKFFTKLVEELLRCKRVGTIAVTIKRKFFGSSVKWRKAILMARMQGPTPRLSDT